MITYDSEHANKTIAALIEYLCVVHKTDYNGLADLIGCNRRWFTRYRNAEFRKKGAATTLKLINLATSVSRKQLVGVLFDE